MTRSTPGSPRVAGNELTDTTSAPAVRNRSSSSTKSASGPTRRLTADNTLPGNGIWRSGCAGSAGTCSPGAQLALRGQQGIEVVDRLHRRTRLADGYAPGRYHRPTMTETIARTVDPVASAAAVDAPAIGGRARIRVGIIGATGYAGGEMVRLLDQHPSVRIVGLQGRGREQEPVGTMHPHLSGTGYHVDASLPEADAVFLALPHGLAAAMARDLVAAGVTIIDQGPDFRLRDPADYPRWYGFEHPAPDLLARSVYGLPGAASARSSRRWATRMSPSSGRPAAIPPRPSSPSRRSRAPGSSRTSWWTPRAASPAPAATPSPT